MVSSIVSRLTILVFGTLYPAYASYKAVKTKNVREYVKWMMYWIVFALFTCVETFADVLVSFWCPFYYEIKIIFLLWLLSPTTKGSSILYRKFVHPMLSKHEKDIDAYLAKAKDSGYDTIMKVGKNTVTMAAETVVKTAITGQSVLVDQLKRYNLEGSHPRRLDHDHRSLSWYGGMNHMGQIEEVREDLTSSSAGSITEVDASSNGSQANQPSAPAEVILPAPESTNISQSVDKDRQNTELRHKKLMQHSDSMPQLPKSSRTLYSSSTLPRSFESSYRERYYDHSTSSSSSSSSVSKRYDSSSTLPGSRTYEPGPSSPKGVRRSKRTHQKKRHLPHVPPEDSP